MANIFINLYAAGDLVSSVRKVKRHGSEFKFFVSILQKRKSSYKIENIGNLWKLWDFLYLLQVRGYKAALRGGNKQNVGTNNKFCCFYQDSVNSITSIVNFNKHWLTLLRVSYKHWPWSLLRCEDFLSLYITFFNVR